MSRRVFVLRNGELVDKAMAGPRDPASPAPMIRTDGMEPIRSMADGRIYDGKSAYYASVRRAGCEIVGDDKRPFERRSTFISQGVGASIKAAIEQLESRG